MVFCLFTNFISLTVFCYIFSEYESRREPNRSGLVYAQSPALESHPPAREDREIGREIGGDSGFRAPVEVRADKFSGFFLPPSHVSSSQHPASDSIPWIRIVVTVFLCC